MSQQQTIGRYRILEHIASGSQGSVHQAYDPETGQIVALKVLHSHLTDDIAYVERFLREASLASQVDHPNVVKIFEVGRDGDRFFISMEYLPQSFARILEGESQMEPDQVASFGIQIAEGLAAAHARRVIHRDIKPQNILIGPQGELKVTDFGTARGEEFTALTGSGVLMGTPQYMSPEQSRGEQVDARTDIYSLGCVLYQMLAGRVPFEGNTPVVIMRRHEEDTPEPLRNIRSDNPRQIIAIVERAMAKDPADRYQSADELASALRRLSGEGRARGAAPVSGQEQPARVVTEEPLPTGRNWRRQGQYTVLGEIGEDDRQGFRRHVQVGADEVVIVRKNGQVTDVFSEDRKPTRTFVETLKSLVGLGPNIEVYKATKTRFNIIFWLGDDDIITTGNKSFTFGLPVMSSDNQMISGRLNLWIEINDKLAENTLKLLKGDNVLNRFDIASVIREDLLGKVLGLELSQHTFDELRGNRPLLEDLGAAIQREISGTLGGYGLRIQDYSISWGLTLQERADIDQQRHQVAADHQRNLNEIEELRNRDSAEDEARSPLGVILRPSKLQLAVTVLGLLTAAFFLSRMVTGDFQQMPWQWPEAPAVAVNFPDAGFDAAMREALGKAALDEITAEELATLEKLDAYDRGIQDLTGLEHATKLTSLNLWDNQISDITLLKSLPNLTELRVYNNQISDVSPLSSLTNLTSLSLSDNQISNVTPLSSLTNLTSLSLGNNQIKRVSPLAYLTNLTTLSLWDNQISDLSPLASLTNLTGLILGNNQISDLSPLASLTNLTSLDLRGNQISDVSPLVSLTNLTTLDLAGNPLSQEGIDTHAPNFKARGVRVNYSVSFPDSGVDAVVREALGKARQDNITTEELATLEKLDAYDRGIQDLTGLEHATKLTSLNLRENQISDLSPLASLTNLTTLSLWDNQISDLSPLASLTNLTGLILWDNPISDLSPLASLANLTHLFLPDNQISDLSPLASLNNLTWLHILDNQISDLSPLASLNNLTWLHILDNQISDLSPLASLTNLTDLNLSDNQISDLSPLASLTNLTDLDLGKNQISDVSPLASLTNLTTLDLSDNPLSQESIHVHLPNLKSQGVDVNQ